MKRTKSKKVELFLDSGAYSAWSQNTEINIHDYIKFIKDHKKLISVYSNLDDITSAKNTYKNQKIMEEAGLSPLPVYHYGEDIKWLKKYLKYGHISLGGMVPISTSKLVPWLDNLFANYLTDKKGMPICKVHGFGLTSLRLMFRYPWYSVDSTAWVVVGRMGGIYLPKKKGGKWVYDEDWKVQVSNRSPSAKEKGQHINTMTKAQKKLMNDYLDEKGYIMGRSEFKTVEESHELADNEKWAEKKEKIKDGKRLLEIVIEEGVSNKYQHRDELNIIYFVDLEKNMPEWPWAFKTSGLQKGMF